MNTRSKRYWQTAFAAAAVLVSAAPSFALGNIAPLGFQGNGSMIIGVDLMTVTDPNMTALAADTSASVNTSTSASYSDAVVSGWAQTSDYGARGGVSASGHDGNTTYYLSGGYFEDELYYESATGQDAVIEFVFNVNNARASLLADGGRAEMALYWTASDGEANTDLSYQYDFFSISNGLAGDTATFNGTVTMAMNDMGNNVFASGTYLPFTLGIWGEVANASMTWLDVSLAEVLVKDTAGNLLDPQSYLLRSTSGSLAFSAFENPPAAVPIPSTILMLSLASAGIAGVRRKMTCAT